MIYALSWTWTFTNKDFINRISSSLYNHTVLTIDLLIVVYD